MAVVVSKRDLENPGDHTAITPPPTPAEGNPFRTRWWYMNAARDKKQDEAQSWDSAQECYDKALAKVEKMIATEAGAPPDGEMLLFTLLDKYNASKVDLRARSRKGIKATVDRIKMRLKNKDVMIGRIDYDAVQAAFSPDQGCTGSNTDEKAVIMLFAALEWARDTCKLSGPNPLKRLKSPKRIPNRRGPFAKSDIETVLTAQWTAEERLMWVLWFYCGWRIGEMCFLRWSDRKVWSDFKYENGRTVFPDSEVPMLHLTGAMPCYGTDFRLKAEREHITGRGLTLTPFIERLMDEAKAEQEARGYRGGVMFPASEGGHWRPDKLRDNWFKPRLLKLGLGHEFERPKKTPRCRKTSDTKIKTKYTPHFIRHTACSLRADLKLSPYMDLEVGHLVPGVHADYVHLAPEARLQESQLISNRLEEIVNRGKTRGKVMLENAMLDAA